MIRKNQRVHQKILLLLSRVPSRFLKIQLFRRPQISNYIHRYYSYRIVTGLKDMAFTLRQLMQHGNLSMLGKTIQCGDFKRMVHAFYQNKKTPLDKPVSEFQKAFTACRLELRAHFDDSKLNAIQDTLVQIIN
jgi:hypothetical protein